MAKERHFKKLGTRLMSIKAAINKMDESQLEQFMDVIRVALGDVDTIEMIMDNTQLDAGSLLSYGNLASELYFFGHSELVSTANFKASADKKYNSGKLIAA